MNAEEIAAKALEYREGNEFYALLDINAALDGVPGANYRFGSDRSQLKAAAAIVRGHP